MDLTTSHELDGIFSNITDIAELTISLIGSLEDTLEMAEDGQVGGFIIIISHQYIFIVPFMDRFTTYLAVYGAIYIVFIV